MSSISSCLIIQHQQHLSTQQTSTALQQPHSFTDALYSTLFYSLHLTQSSFKTSTSTTPTTTTQTNINMFTKTTVLAGLASIAAAAPTHQVLPRAANATASACPAPVAYNGIAGFLSDTVTNFLYDPVLCAVSQGAAVPSGYSTLFTDAKGSNQQLYGYMGYEQVPPPKNVWDAVGAYNTAYCAAQCDAKAGCASFNIYYERDPTVDPTATCQNPASTWNFLGTTSVRCAYYSSFVDVSTTTNKGQFRELFQVAITGSNGYVKNSVFNATGYTPMNGTSASGHLASDKALNAPLACGVDTYAGVEWWTDGTFSVQRCANSCSTHTAWTNQHGGSPCKSFNTYLQRDSTTNIVQQMCAFYTQETDPAFAVNGGNAQGTVTVFESYAFTVANYPGNTVCDVKPVAA
jgi:hypothetical protein